SGAGLHDLHASLAEHPPDTSRQLCASTFAYLSLLQKFIEPRQRSLKRIDPILWLAEAMAFARITNEDGFDATTTQRHVHLLSLRYMHVVVLFAMDEKRGRQRLFHVTQRRPLPEQFVIVPGKTAELRVNQVLIKRS